MKLTWYGHACFKLETDCGSVVFDPYAPGSVKGLKLPEITADAVVCSHRHSDHYCPEAVTLTGLKPGFAMRSIYTFHDESMGAKRGNNLMTVVTAEDLTVAHCGDLGHELNAETLRSLGKIDILLIPVGGVYTLAGLRADKAHSRHPHALPLRQRRHTISRPRRRVFISV